VKPWGELEVDSVFEDGWEADDDFEAEDLSGVWRRPAGEYVPGLARLQLCSMEEARFAHVKADLDLDERETFLTGIRGNDFHPEAYTDATLRGEVWFELVPEPSNPHDPHALALDLNGVRAGHVGASMAPYYQWLVRAANGSGKRCLVPGFIENPASAWVVLPTLRVAQDRLAAESVLTRLRAVWDLLPAELHRHVEADGFHPSEETAAELWGYRRLEPTLFPVVPDPGAYSPGWGRMLNSVRLERNERRVEERRLKREAEVAEKETRRREREKSVTLPDDQIRELFRAGESKAGIGRSLGVSHDTIRKVLGDHEGRPSQGGTSAWSDATRNDRIQRCFRALELQRVGASRAQIARLVGTSPESVKDLLADGRFYQDPESYPERLALARQAVSEGWTNTMGRAVGASGLRAAKDARVLTKIGRADAIG